MAVWVLRSRLHCTISETELELLRWSREKEMRREENTVEKKRKRKNRRPEGKEDEGGSNGND